jgi:hypothetical protein
MAIFYTDSGSLSDLVVSNKLEATGSLFGTASYGLSAGFAQSANFNVSASSVSNNVSQLVFSNSNNVSFGLNGSTLTATATAAGATAFTYPYFNPYDAYVQVAGVLGSNSLYFQPFQSPNVQFDRLAIPIFLTYSTTNASATLSFYWGLYTRNASTLSLLTDVSTVIGNQLTFSATNSSLYQGLRLLTGGITKTITEGQYYVGFMSRVTTAGSSVSFSNIVISQQSSAYSGIFGAAANATDQYTRGLGAYSTTTAALPSSVAFSQITGQSSQFLRAPIFYLVSQTF